MGGPCPGPIILQAWLDGDRYHSFCPVKVLRLYMTASRQSSPTRLFLSPSSGWPLSRLQLSSERLRCDQRSEASFPGSRLLGITWVSDHTQTSAELFTKQDEVFLAQSVREPKRGIFILKDERCLSYIRDCHYLSSLVLSSLLMKVE